MRRSELFIDIETYSATDLITAGVYRYVEDPDFAITFVGWAFDDDPVEVTDDTVTWVNNTADYLMDPAFVKIAHNAAFERICFSRVLLGRTDVYLPPEEWHDTQAIAAERAYPQKLETLARVLGGEQKDAAGTRLINLFAKPNREGRRVMPHEKPEDWAAFGRYCGQDVVTLRDLHRKLGGWPSLTERAIFYADQHINDRGIRIDREMARLAHARSLDNQLVQEKEFRELTGVDNPASVPQVKAWVADQGLEKHLPTLRAEVVEKALLQDLEPHQRRALELRQELALVASKKYAAALASVCSDDRLRGSFRFHGAHTGRWTGRGFQPHNMPRHGFENEVDQTIAIDELKAGEEITADELKRLVRPLIILGGAVVDYSSIEARVIAWLAGEEWALQAFRDGRDIYVETANMMGGLTRAQGKVAVLALGFAGGAGSLRVMAGDNDLYKGKPIKLLPDEQLQASFVYPWRAVNRRIVELWANLERAFVNGGAVNPYLFVERHGTDRAIRLPSGRRIWYHDVKPGQRITFLDHTRGGMRTDTYGGRLAENATQGIARDLLGEALVRLERNGFDTVAHVHDEILVEGAEVEPVRQIMIQNPAWATDLPIDAEGFACDRYRKG